MNTQVKNCAVQIGDFAWYPVKLIGDKYFMVATKPLFKGYYSLEPGDFQRSRLSSFLNKKFIAFLENDGVDTSKISLMAILTQGQYNLYVYNKLPLCGTYLLQTPVPEHPDNVLAVQADGSLSPVHITDKMSIRPCFFIEAEYLHTIHEQPVQTTEDVYAAEQAAEEKRQREAAAAAEAARIAAEEEERVKEEARQEAQRRAEEETARIAAEQEAARIAAEREAARIAAEREAERLAAAEAMRIAEEEAERIRIEEEEKARVAAEEQARLQAAREEAERKAQEERLRIEAERAEARRQAEELERREAAAKAELEAQEEARRKAKEAAAPVVAPHEHTGSTVDEAVVEQLGQGRKIETDKEGQHAVYVYQDEHKDYAFLVNKDDIQLQKSIERMGIAIRAYLASDTNEKRNPMQKSNVHDHIARLQNRWRG